MSIFFVLWGCIEEAVELPPPKKEELVVEPEQVEEPAFNHPPVIHSLEWENPQPKVTDAVRITVNATDQDNDRIRYTYTWKVNGGEKRTEGRAFLPSHYYKKGDVIRLEVVAADKEKESSPSAVELTIANTPPTWKEDPRTIREIDGYQVQATDIDNDEITYSLEGAPKGMTIDSKTGILSYKGSVDAKRGKYEIHVLATDTDGAFVKWSFSINVQ